MRETLFHIPNGPFAGLPVFGAGWLLILWAVAGAGLLAWRWRREGWSGDTLGYVPLLLLIGAAIWLVLPRLCDKVGLPIRGYGVMLLVAVASSVALGAWRAHRLGIDPEMIFSLAFWAFVPGIAGARLFYVIEYWETFQRATWVGTLGQVVNVAEGGLVVYGSLIGGLAGIVAFLVRYKLPALATFDLIAPSLVLGLAIGRIGCFLNGCCFGGVCELPWAVRFPVDSPPYKQQAGDGRAVLYGLGIDGAVDAPPVITRVVPGSQAEKHGLRPGQKIAAIDDHPVHTAEAARQRLLHAHEHGPGISVTTTGAVRASWTPDRQPTSQPVHPTQLYSAINGFLLCLLLLAFDPFHRRDGQVWALALTLYPITRFVLEIIRKDEAPVFHTGLSISQNVSLALLVCAVVLWTVIYLRPAGTAFPTWRDVDKRV